MARAGGEREGRAQQKDGFETRHDGTNPRIVMEHEGPFAPIIGRRFRAGKQSRRGRALWRSTPRFLPKRWRLLSSGTAWAHSCRPRESPRALKTAIISLKQREG